MELPQQLEVQVVDVLVERALQWRQAVLQGALHQLERERLRVRRGGHLRKFKISGRPPDIEFRADKFVCYCVIGGLLPCGGGEFGR